MSEIGPSLNSCKHFLGGVVPAFARRWASGLYLGVTAFTGIAVVASPGAAGTLKAFTYDSPALGQNQTAQVYVPDGAAPVAGWPVLYLLHGLNGSATDWQTIGNIRGTLDRLIGQRAIKPLVVVMPEGGNSWYVDSAEVNGPGNYASAISHDLPKAVESAFPVGHDRAHRAIAGLSMGGYGAFRLALAEPERYGAAAALSPAFWQNMPAEVMGKSSKDLDLIRSTGYFKASDPATVTVGVDLPPDGKHFGAAFGTPFDPRRFNAANVFTLLQRDVDTKKNLPELYITVGDDDSHRLWRGAFAFFETMQMNGREVEFRVTDGDHDWHCWKSSIVDALAFVDKNLAGDVTQ